MKRLILIVMSIMIMFSATSCKESKRELERLAVVIAAGFDLTAENEYLVTLQILNPQKQSGNTMGGQKSGGSQGGSDVIIVSEKGATPTDAVSHISTILGKELFWAHSKFSVLGENLAQSGLALFLDASLRSNQTRPDVPLLVTKGMASSIITTVTSDEKISATSIERLLKGQSIIGYTPVISRLDFTSLLAGKSKNPIAAVIDFRDNDITGRNLELAGTAVFKKDKLIGYLDKKETRGLNWIRGKIKSGSIVAYLSDGSSILFDIVKSSSKVYPIVNDNDLTMVIEVKEQGNIRETLANIDPMKKPELMNELSKVQNKAIEGEIKMALQKAQKELDADIFDFAGAIHRDYPKVWKSIEGNWDEIFPSIKTKVNVNSSLKTPGIISKPFK
jgi:spore germination protein KC